MKWFLILNPFACLKLLLLAICVFTIGYLLAINVPIVEMDDANASKHKFATVTASTTGVIILESVVICRAADGQKRDHPH